MILPQITIRFAEHSRARLARPGLIRYVKERRRAARDSAIGARYFS